MREYSKIFPQIWIGKTGKQIKSLGIEAQLLAYYLMSSPHATMIGIYYLPFTLIIHETGLPIEKTSIAFQKLIEIDFCSYDEAMEYVWVHNMAFYQVGFALKFNDNRVKNMNELYKLLPKLHFIEKFYDKYKEAFFLEGAHECSKSLARNLEASSKPGVEAGEGTRKEIETEKNITLLMDHETQNNFSYLDQAKQILDFLNEKTETIHPPTHFKRIDIRYKVLQSELYKTMKIHY